MTAGLGRFRSFCEGIGCGVVCFLFARSVLFVFCVVVRVWRFRLTVSWTLFHRLRREYVSSSFHAILLVSGKSE